MTPFAVLGLPASDQVTDEDVRVAWRRVAEATHPDRSGGGHPAIYAEAAAAYSALRTAAGRGEALADIRGLAAGQVAGYPVSGGKYSLVRLLLVVVLRIRRGRPARLAVRLLAVAAAGALAVAGVGWQPASLAVVTGALTWLLCTGRSDLARDRRN